MKRLLVVSPCLYPNSMPAKLMVESAMRNGLAVELYGIGQQFVAHGADAQVVKLYEYMQAQQAQYVLVTDCRDVLFLASEDEIMWKYESYDSPLVMSAERGCWPPDEEVLSYFRPRPHGYTYVNAGQYMGEWQYVLACLKHLLDKYRNGQGLDNSQPWWALAKARGELSYELDSTCLLFQTMSGSASDHVVEHGRRLWNRYTETFPCSVHFNGNPGNDVPQRYMYSRLFTKVDESGMPYAR